MKLATLKRGGRDGTLIVVDRALQRAVHAGAIAPTLQGALDDWSRAAPGLQSLSEALEADRAEDAFALSVAELAAPLPRAYQFLDGSAYLPHVERARRARGASLPPRLATDPLMYQAVSDGFLGPREPISVADAQWGIDFESEIGVICDDVPMGVSAAEAGDYVRLITLINDVSLRELIPEELGKNFGFLVSKPRSALAPIVATPDELGDAWAGSKVHLPLLTHYNGALFGRPEAGEDMQFSFAQLLAHAAQTRPLAAGTLIGSGTVANADESRGASCLAEIRALEMIRDGAAQTPFMRFGDTVAIEMHSRGGESLFGRIEQEVVPYRR